jgi:ribosomal protein S25
MGRWELVNAKGAVEMRLDVTESGAKKDHAPDSPGTCEIAGPEMRITWEDAFRDILRIEDNGTMSFLQFGKNKRRWDARHKRRLNAKRIEPPKPPTKGEKCRQELLEYCMKQKHASTLDDPELFKRAWVQVNKDYNPADDPINFALREELKPRGKGRKRPDVNKEEQKRKTMQKLQKAIKDSGPKVKPSTLIAKAGLNRNLALECLRELKEAGEYTGFSRRRRAAKY